MTDEKTYQYVDAEQAFNKEEDLSFRSIIMSHFKKVINLSCVEFRGGYWTTKTKLNAGGVTQSDRVYIPDTREEYCNAIDMLHDVSLPYIIDDPDMLNASKKIYQQIEEARADFLKSTNSKEVLSHENYEEKDKRQTLEEYKHINLRLHRILFQELSLFFARQDYFSVTGLIDG